MESGDRLGAAAGRHRDLSRRVRRRGRAVGRGVHSARAARGAGPSAPKTVPGPAADFRFRPLSELFFAVGASTLVWLIAKHRGA